MPGLPGLPVRSLLGKTVGLSASAGLAAGRLAGRGSRAAGTAARVAAGSAGPLLARVSAAGRPSAAAGEAGGVGAEPARQVPAAQLPVPDLDRQTPGMLRARLGRLDLAQLLELQAYEQAHANRPQVLTLLETRIARLREAPALSGGRDVRR